MIPSIEQEIRDLHALLGSAQDPEGRAFVPLADAYRRAGDPDRALELLERGLERHPDLAAGYLMQALARRDLADDAGAEAAYRRVLALDGDNARALVGLGRLIRSEGQDEEAERLIRRGVALDPRLASEGTPDRVPRHSTNPEVVSADSLAPLEWEVLDPPQAAAPEEGAEPLPDVGVEAGVADHTPAPSEAVDAEVAGAVDETEAGVAEAVDEIEAEAVEAVVETEAGVVEAMVDHDPSPPEMVGLADAEASLLEALEPVVDLDAGQEELAQTADSLDIEWEVEEFYQPLSDDASVEPTPTLAPESATADAEPPAASDPELPPSEIDRLIEALSVAGGESSLHTGADAAVDDVAPETAIEIEAPDGAVEADAEVTEPADGDFEVTEPTDGAFEVTEPTDGEFEVELSERTDGEDEVEELIVDAWTLAPDGWTPDPEREASVSEPPSAEPVASDPVSLADLAPDAASGSGTSPAKRRDDAALPTRTLGELYAKQGLTVEAIEVFRELAEAEPSNLEHRARITELEAILDGAGRSSGGPETALPAEPEPDDPPISEFFETLLAWAPAEPSRQTPGGDD